MLSFVPDLFSHPFVGILLCVIVYAIGSGLIEVLCSPIIEACPFENKAGMMSLLHLSIAGVLWVRYWAQPSFS